MAPGLLTLSEAVAAIAAWRSAAGGSAPVIVDGTRIEPAVELPIKAPELRVNRWDGTARHWVDELLLPEEELPPRHPRAFPRRRWDIRRAQLEAAHERDDQGFGAWRTRLVFGGLGWNSPRNTDSGLGSEWSSSFGLRKHRRGRTLAAYDS